MTSNHPLDRIIKVRDKLMVAEAAMGGDHAITGDLEEGIMAILGEAHDELTALAQCFRQAEKGGAL